MDEIWLSRARRIGRKLGSRSRTHARLLAVLLAHERAPVQTLIAAIDSASADPEGLLRVQLSLLRRRLDGVARIESLSWGAQAYRLDDAGRAALLELAGPDDPAIPKQRLTLKREWLLTEAQSAIMEAILAAPDLASNGDIEAAGFRGDISVHVFRIRQKIARFGLTIENVPGQGYRLSDESRAKLAGQKGRAA